jgi:hypothetical protein
LEANLFYLANHASSDLLRFIVPSVSDSFQTLLKRVQPPPGEIAAANGHLAAIKTRIETCYTSKKFFTAGSFNRGTFIRGKSDVDAYAVLSLDEIRWGTGWKTSLTVLNDLRRELEGRFRYTAIRRDIHAIVLEFSDGKIDVVPAAWGEFSKEYKRPIYFIPDGTGKWMKTSPELHNDYLIGRNDECGGKQRATAQLIKFWRECRSPRISLSSFHIEMLLACENICSGVKGYADWITDIFQILAERECVGMRDPFGICGNIPALKTEAQRSTALATIKHSRNHAKEAVAANARGNTAEALRQWDIVFHGKFPK